LDQDTEFEVRIVASGRTRFGKTRDVTTSHRFTTGRRPTTVFFSEIDVWRDGDPGLKGDGEFTFSFGAGDADSRTNLGEPWPGEYKGDINDDDPPKFINKSIDMAFGPRNLWIEVIGTEDDGDFFSGIYFLGRKPNFRGAGTNWVDTGHEYQVSVTGVFDISDAVYGTTLPLELVTGNFGVGFTIRGTIFIQTQPGKSPFIFDLSDSIAAAGGVGKLVSVGGTGSLPGGRSQEGGLAGRHDMLVARGADGAIYRKVTDAERRQSRDAGWTLAAPVVEGPVTALSVGSGRVALFAVDAEGAALYAESAGSGSGDARPTKWFNLGGRFTGAVTAVALATSIELLACDDAGAVYHLTLPLKGGKPDSDWRRIGEKLSGEIKPVHLDKDAFALFALSTSGEVMHRIYRSRRWHGWQVISGAIGVQLGAAAAGFDSTGADSMGVVLAVIGEDEKLHTLAWRDYPKKKPARWVAQGDFQSWLVRPLKAPRRVKAELKPTQLRAAALSRRGHITSARRLGP
jgi:hypothetical protein